MGILAPHFNEMGERFNNMWKEAESEPEKWGRTY